MKFNPREMAILKASLEARIREIDRIAKHQNWLASERAASVADVILFARSHFDLDLEY